MRAVPLIAGAAALAACSNPADTPQATTAPPAQAAAPTSPAAQVPSPMAGAGGGMSGTVSALTGAVSGLNVRVTEFGTVVDLPADALFDYDKASLTPAAEGELRKAADLIRKAPPGPIAVIGHTDSHGEDSYNQTLSEARARTVADWFGQQVGVRQRAFQISGKGERAPIAPNETAGGADNPDGRRQNRRVEVVLPKG